MRYLLQAMTMIGDILFFLAVGTVLYYGWHSNPVVLLITVIAFYQWNKSGGFEAWHPSMVRKFMVRAKRLGL